MTFDLLNNFVPSNECGVVEGKQYVFIDESGIQFHEGYSTFVMVYVTVQDYPLLEQQVLQLENSLNVQSFHWARHGWKVKQIL